MAVTDFLLKADPVKGEVKDSDYPDALQIKGWSIAASTPTDMTTGQSRGRMQITNLTVTKEIDKSSPQLMQAVRENRMFPLVKLICRKAGGDPKGFFLIELSNARIAAVSLKASTGVSGTGLMPEETAAISFTKIKMTYKEQDSKGALLSSNFAEFDTAANVGE